MKVNAEKFGRFLELINLGGDLLINECILRGDKDKLSVLAVHPGTKAVFVNGEFKGDFSSLGVVGVDDLTILRKMVNSMSGDIDIATKTNKLVLTKSKKLSVELVMRASQYILNEIDRAKWDVTYTKSHNNSFVITPANMSEFFKHYGIFGKHLLISGEGNTVEFNITHGDNKLDLSIEIVETVKKFDIKLNGFVMKIFELVKDMDSTFSITDDKTPMIVNTKTDDYEFNYLVAPMVK